MAFKFGADFLRLVLPKELEYKFGITPKPMEFPVERPEIKRITKDIIPVGKKPTLTQKQAFEIFPKYTTQQIAEKRGEVPTTKISPELAKEAGEQISLTAFGVTAPLKVDPIKNYLAKNVSLEAEKSVGKGLRQGLSDLYTAVVDRFNPIVKISRKAGELKAGENPEILARRYLGIKGISESKLFWKTFNTTAEGNLKITGDGLSKILKPAQNNLDDLRALMIAERDIELTQRGIKGVPLSERIMDIKVPEGVQIEIMDIVSTLDTATAGERVMTETGEWVGIKSTFPKWLPQELKSSKLFQSFSDKISSKESFSANEEKLFVLIKNRIKERTNFDITREMFAGEEQLKVKFSESQNIINLLKEKSEFEQINTTATQVRDFTRKAILDPLKEVGAISDDVYNKIIKSNQFYTPFNRLMGDLEQKGFIPTAKQIFSPKAVPLKTIKGSERQIIDPLESIIQNVYKVTDFVEREKVAKSVVNLRNLSDDLAEMIKPVKPIMKPIMEKGELLTFRPLPYTTEKNTIQVFENGIRKFYQVPEDLAKAMNNLSTSGMNILLKILGAPARTLRAGATLTPEFIGRNPIRDQFSAMVFSKYGYRPPIDFVNGVWSAIGKNDLYYKWQASGGAQSMFVSLDRISGQKKLQQVIGKKQMIYNPLEALRALSEFGEKGTRIGTFKRALQKGIPELEAGFESRDITLDFSRIGSQTKAVNQIIAFFNANVQGLDKLARSFVDRPLQTSVKATLGITVPSISLYLLQKDNPRYQELPQWQKDLFWIIIPPGEKSPIIRIPKPFELGIIFGTVPEHILTWIYKNEPEQLTNIPQVLGRGASPGMIPNIMLPILENQANYSFFRDRPIISQSIENLPPELQTNTYTSETAKEIGKIIKQSPAKIENLVWGYFAGMGGYSLDIADEILKKFNVVSPPEQPAKTLADIPFIKAFIAKEPIGSQSESVNKFYDILEEARQKKAGVEDMAKKGQKDEAVKYLQENKEAIYVKGLNKIAQDFAEIRKKKEIVYNDRNLTPEQKKRVFDALDSLMTEIARQALELIKQSQ